MRAKPATGCERARSEADSSNWRSQNGSLRFENADGEPCGVLPGYKRVGPTEHVGPYKGNKRHTAERSVCNSVTGDGGEKAGAEAGELEDSEYDEQDDSRGRRQAGFQMGDQRDPRNGCQANDDGHGNFQRREVAAQNMGEAKKVKPDKRHDCELEKEAGKSEPSCCMRAAQSHYDGGP